MLRKLIDFISPKPAQPHSSLSDFSVLAVDMHSHLIPGIDDGVRNMDSTVEVLRQMQQWGYKKVITTPHVMADGYNNSPEVILKGRDLVRKAIAEQGIPIQFEAAAEYYLDEAMDQRLEEKQLLSFGDNYLLTEISLMGKPNYLFDLIYKLQNAGYKIILAHPERYPYYYGEELELYSELRLRNVYFQINMMSLIGKYGEKAKVVAEAMIDNNMVDFVGTDLHGRRHLGFIHQCLKEKYLEKVVGENNLLNKTLL